MITLDGKTLNIEAVVAVARNLEKVKFSNSAIEAVRENREKMEKLIASGKVMYGVNTGFGELLNTRISENNLKQLQKNLVMSHAVGVGKNFDKDIVRATMLIRLNTLLKGNSGVRPELLALLKELLNKDIIPLIPEQGSVGASGDLAPLAHMSLSLIGKGMVQYQNRVISAKKALELTALTPIELSYKEGVALINGTTVMTAIATLALYDSFTILKNAIIAAALSFEALKGNDDAFENKLLALRPHYGQTIIGTMLKAMLQDSDIIKISKRTKIQDAYSLRCIPQVLGPVYDTLRFASTITETELNAVTDNPVILDRVYSGCNFHGEYIGLIMDYLGIAMAELSNISERRIARLVDHKLSGLPPFLVKHSGLNSGLMLLQYTAAALVSENKVLAHPATVDSIPTSANQEDHVSMGTIAARKARQIIENVKNVVAIEFLTAAQALEFREQNMAKHTAVIYQLIREHVTPLTADRELIPDLNKIKTMMENKIFINHIPFLRDWTILNSKKTVQGK